MGMGIVALHLDKSSLPIKIALSVLDAGRSKRVYHYPLFDQTPVIERNPDELLLRRG
jgi:alpha-D-ribose 1-methylphosphonate 5-phosphate C-P lyase